MNSDRIGDFLMVQPPFDDWKGFLAFTILALRPDGTSVSFKAVVDEVSRRELEAALAPVRLTWLSLEHGNKVVEIAPRDAMFEEPSTSFASPVQPAPANPPIPFFPSTSPAPSIPFSPKADAGVVCTPGYAVALTTADCVPIIVASAACRKISVIHAGWRGIAAGVIEACCSSFISCCGGTLPEDTKAWIGPAIAGSDYEVADETRSLLLQSPSVRPEHFVPTTIGHCLADLPAMAQAKLEATGISADGIFMYPASTISDTQFHSARRDGEAAGRMATVVGIPL